MWFKNLQVYRLATGWAMSPGTLEAALNKQPLMPCTGMSMMSRGWVPPAEGFGLVFGMGKHLLLALGVEEKVLPASVMREETKLRAVTLEAQQGYKPGKKQLRDLQERITTELLPRAFAKRRVTRAWIDPVNLWMVVDAASPSRAEELLEHLRNTLGELPVTRLETELSPQGAMTQWLTVGDAPAQFALDSECELKGTGEEAATVRYLRHDLSIKEIREHIAGGKVATRVGLLWRDRMSLLLVEPFQIKRVKSLAMEQGGDEGAGVNQADQFEADFALMAGELGSLLKDLLAALGGEKDPEAPARKAGDNHPLPLSGPKNAQIFTSLDGESDPIYPQALALLPEKESVSVSFVQRRLGIGYNRAAQLIERMESEGLVGPPSAAGQRQLLSKAASA